MRKTLVVLAVLALAALGVDRVAELLVERAAADEARSRLELTSTPDVEVGGFPFLTQVVMRRFEQVRVDASEVPMGRLTAGRVGISATDLAVDPSLPLESRAARVRADVLLPYAELSRLAPERVRLGSAGGGLLEVSAPVGIPGREVDAVARSRVTLEAGMLVVRARSVSVGGTPLADTGLAPRVRGTLDFSVPLDGLPAGLRLTGVRPGPEGLQVVAEGRGLALARVAAAWR
ncbi:MAG: LmeA family phospholipid-binding protein [Actinomycetes bacterium]